MVPKKIISISGTISTNSTAAMPLVSSTRRHACWRSRNRNTQPACMLRPRLHAECGGRGQQPRAAAGVATEIGNVVAELRHEQRPLIERTDQDRVAGTR